MITLIHVHGDFHVRVDEEKVDSDEVLNNFNKGKEEIMQQYTELITEERTIMLQRKKILETLKEEFKVFAKVEYPECFL